MDKSDDKIFSGIEEKVQTPSVRKNLVRVGCISWPQKEKRSVTSVEANAADAIAAIGWLDSSRPDIVCLPEGFLCAGMKYSSASKVALELNALALKQFAQVASDLKIYLAVPFMEQSDEIVYNSVVLFDRSGSRIGIYRKQLLWPSNDQFTEFEYGIVPGDGGGPFMTEFGPVGIQICLEIHWPSPWRRLKWGGAKLILFPSQQPGGMLLRHRAWQARCFIVSAVSKGGSSQVIDPVGNVIAEWWPETPRCTIDLGLDFEMVHFDHNEEKLKELMREWRGLLEMNIYRPERLCKVTSLDASIDLKSVLKARDILPLDEYISRVKEANDCARLFESVDLKV